MAPKSISRVVTIVLCLALTGCGKPSEEARQNRRLLDAVLTAMTTRNQEELRKDEALINKRLADGMLSAPQHSSIKQAIEKARAGDWSTALEDLYRFRDSTPFPE